MTRPMQPSCVLSFSPHTDRPQTEKLRAYSIFRTAGGGRTRVTVLHDGVQCSTVHAPESLAIGLQGDCRLSQPHFTSALLIVMSVASRQKSIKSISSGGSTQNPLGRGSDCP